MSKITITEALAELPTIAKRIASKEKVIQAYLARQSKIRDPHEKDGGSAKLIEETRQSINDLEVRVVSIRAAITQANMSNSITINGVTDTISNWLVWRREIAPHKLEFLRSMFRFLDDVRSRAKREGVAIRETDDSASNDYIVNINEKELTDEIEFIETTLGILDGQLSLKNATIVVDIS